MLRPLDQIRDETREPSRHLLPGSFPAQGSHLQPRTGPRACGWVCGREVRLITDQYRRSRSQSAGVCNPSAPQLLDLWLVKRSMTMDLGAAFGKWLCAAGPRAPATGGTGGTGPMGGIVGLQGTFLPSSTYHPSSSRLLPWTQGTWSMDHGASRRGFSAPLPSYR